MNSATILCPDKAAVGQVGVKNDKIDGSSNFNNNIFSHFEKDISLMEKSFAWYFQLRFMSIFTTRYLTLSIGQKSLLQQSYWYTIDYVISKVASLAKCYCLRSFIYNKKGGPRTDPWGMPKYKAATPGWKSFKDTYWLH